VTPPAAKGPGLFDAAGARISFDPVDEMRVFLLFFLQNKKLPVFFKIWRESV
jgi:hypothetical protein